MVRRGVLLVCALSVILNHAFSIPLQNNLPSFGSGSALGLTNGLGTGLLGSNKLGSTAVSETVVGSTVGNFGFNNEALIGTGFGHLGNLNSGLIGGPTFGNLGLSNNLALNNDVLVGSTFGNLANSAQGAILTGTVAQAVAPTYSANIAANTQLSPVVTEIVPSLEFGDLTIDGALPVGGVIKVKGTFPVYGVIGVDGSLPSYGMAYIDTGNGLIPQSLDLCQC
ncbi:uncharacterized protein LOC116413755 [Galleria mellonella]|uniref:Uncharacterized protein LOC116413755 n=1 Tax=Galleria mellonella TaxID=7137 RepID=A0A6J3CGU0_GALME|nr:uncharacterized protein LOC116413755 [Galleria mellonella]